jgi:hypothetical protein
MMSETSFPFSASPILTETQFRRLMRAVGAVSGVVAQDPSGTNLRVTASNSSVVTVQTGEALVDGFYYQNSTTKNLNVPSNAGGASARIDRVVLRADPVAGEVTAEYVTGGSTEPSVTQDESGTYEIPLARVTVAAHATTVGSGDLLDERWFTGRVVPVGGTIYGRPPNRGQLAILGTATAPLIWLGTGTDWIQVYPEPAPAFSTLALASGWTNSGGGLETAGYTKLRFGLVLVKGSIKATVNHSDNAVVATLPVGCRPAAGRVFASVVAGVFIQIDVNVAGSVIFRSPVNSGQSVSLDPIVFTAA